jgi:hypothetical protein
MIPELPIIRSRGYAVTPDGFWNRYVVGPLTRGTALSGARCKVLQTSGGQSVSLDPSAMWQHPWFTSAVWDPARALWVCSVRPGFVNGVDPHVPSVREDGGPEVGLTDNPRIPIFSWTPRDGSPGARIPEFFARMGVRNEFAAAQAAFDLSGPAGVTVNLNPLEDSDGSGRRLASAEVWVAVARATFTTDITELDATGTSGRIVDMAARFDDSTLRRLGTRARLVVGPALPQRPPPLTPLQRLMGESTQDDGEDRHHIATIFLLSPEEPRAAAQPDATWTPFVQHHTFWNLAHAARNEPPPRAPQPIRLATGLLAGLGDIIGNQMLAPLNDLTAAIGNAISNLDNTGRFWTV